MRNSKIKIILLAFSLSCLFITSSVVELNAKDKIISIKEKMREASAETEGPRWYEYEPHVVTLKGTIIEMSDYGPPNYGENPETDQKVRYCVLKLDTPINIKADFKSNLNTDTFRNECMLQLVVSYDNLKDLREKLNKKVIVKGTLFQRHTGHHYTNVLIIVNDIELLNNEGI